MRRKPIAPRMAPSARPAHDLAPHHAPPVAQRDLAERQRADDQRRRLRPGVAAARDDQRHEQREHDGLRDLLLEEAHRRRGQHFAEEQRRQPAGALLDHPAEARSPCTARRAPPIRRCAGCPRVAAASATSSTSSIGDDADEHAGGVGDRQRRAIVLPEHGDRGLLVVGGLQRHEPPVHQVRDALAERRAAGTRGCGCRRSAAPCSSTT